MHDRTLKYVICASIDVLLLTLTHTSNKIFSYTPEENLIIVNTCILELCTMLCIMGMFITDPTVQILHAKQFLFELAQVFDVIYLLFFTILLQFLFSSIAILTFYYIRIKKGFPEDLVTCYSLKNTLILSWFLSALMSLLLAISPSDISLTPIIIVGLLGLHIFLWSVTFKKVMTMARIVTITT